jgi:hypothetical protein
VFLIVGLLENSIEISVKDNAIKKVLITKRLKGLFVTPSGFEPETYSLEVSCSIQLSYGAISESERKSNFIFSSVKAFCKKTMIFFLKSFPFLPNVVKLHDYTVYLTIYSVWFFNKE